MPGNPQADVQHVPLLNVIWRDKETADANAQQVLAFMAGLGLDAYRPPADARDWVLRHEAALGTAPDEWMALCRQFMSIVQRLERERSPGVSRLFRRPGGTGAGDGCGPGHPPSFDFVSLAGQRLSSSNEFLDR